MPVNKSGKQQRPIWSPTCGEECRRDDEDDVPRPEGAGEVVLEEQVGVGEHVVHDELHVEGLVLDCLVRGLKGTSKKRKKTFTWLHGGCLYFERASSVFPRDLRNSGCFSQKLYCSTFTIHRMNGFLGWRG